MRFIRNFKDQTISYELKPIKITGVNNKRNPIYKNGILIDTNPLIVIDNEVQKHTSNILIVR